MKSLSWGKVRIPSSFILTKYHVKFALDPTSDTTSSLGFSMDTKCPLVSLLLVWGEAKSGFHLVVCLLSIMPSLPRFDIWYLFKFSFYYRHKVSSSIVIISLRWGEVKVPSSFMLSKHHAKFAWDQTYDTTSSLGSSTYTKCPIVSLWIVLGEAKSGFHLVVCFLSIMPSLPQIRHIIPLLV